ncbi:MAG: acetyl-CoA carboxylase biotin carboxylase subunit [Pseudomonadales bacterium]|nr:acetyl-CoA carboxylase biotin carboxylase subunit [Pseudomonadales bacterium]
MPKRVLIANRGEIALRIARACREAGVQSVAVHTRVEAGQPWLDVADDTVCVSDASYLDAGALLAAATSRGCDALHPGYGLLSEQASFFEQAEAAGLVLIGPASGTLRLMGDKVAARALAADHGFQVLGDATKPANSPGDVAAAQVGYPLLLKAVHGGGGRGMRLVRSESELPAAFAEAGAEAAAAFGSGELYPERYVESARHVEVQVLGDGQGGAIHLGTRDCSVQRRHQKLIEEAPAPFVDADALATLCAQCSAFAAAIGYRSAGTLEFLYDGENFYFIEMNARIQVEHPVTEVITGVDLVRAQLFVAEHGRLPLTQDEVTFHGHAIECRVNAEHFDLASGDVAPAPGTVTGWIAPGGPGIRLDSHLSVGASVPHQYDSLVAKLIGYGRDRDEALRRLDRGIGEFGIRGIGHNLAALGEITRSPQFRAGELDTGMVDHFRKRR